MSGREEHPDPRPVEWPAGVSRPLSLQDEIKRFVRVELSRQVADQGFETFEEADDFEVEDEEEYVSPYEMKDMAEDTPPPTAEPQLQSPQPDSSKLDKQEPDKTSSVSSTGPKLTEPSAGTPAGGPT